MPGYPVATLNEIPPGSRKIVEIAGRSIGVFNVGGAFYALRNRCPHQGGPLCQGRLEGSGFQGPAPSPYPKGSPYAARIDAMPPAGGIPGSDLSFMREQLLDRWEIEYAVLHCLYNLWSVQNEDFALALARAVNDWTLAEWLEREPRLRAAIVVPINNTERAAT